MATNRLIELAIKGLETERAKLDQELSDLRRQLNSPTSRPAPARPTAAAHAAPAAPAAAKKTPPKKSGGLTAEGRRKLSELARKRWAANRKSGKTTL